MTTPAATLDALPSLVVDSHAHFWQPAAGDGTTPSGGALGVADLLDRLDAAGVDRLVQVTRLASGFDNTESLGGAAAHPDRIRVLARFDVRASDAPARLDELVAEPLVGGIRLYEDPRDDPAWLGDDRLGWFWTAASRHRFPVSVFAPGQVDAVAAIAGRHADLPLVVDHLGLAVFAWMPPERRADEFDATMELRRLPNVSLKLSGAPEATDEAPPYPRAAVLARRALELWPPSRVMWGSNHPPSSRVGSYGDMVEFVRRACVGLDAAARADVLGGTALRMLWRC